MAADMDLAPIEFMGTLGKIDAQIVNSRPNRAARALVIFEKKFLFYSCRNGKSPKKARRKLTSRIGLR